MLTRIGRPGKGIGGGGTWAGSGAGSEAGARDKGEEILKSAR
jgi:hypothetical protein|tara:strand:+ start:2707 stop:2832 length:126 start_codon:yes stop_codon:yes gene_type:complete